MRRKMTNIATLWLPVIGGGILWSIAVSAWFSGSRIPGIWFGFFGTVCLILLAAIQIQQVVQSAKPDALSVKSERPFVGIDSVETGAIQAGVPYRVVIQYKNYGVLPANNLRVMNMWRAQSADVPEIGIPLVSPENAGVVLMPGAKVSSVLEVGTFDKEATNEITSGAKTFWIVGQVVYADQFGTLHHTPYRMRYVPQSHAFGPAGREPASD